MSNGRTSRSRLLPLLDYAQMAVYYGIALALVVTIGVMFVSIGDVMLSVFEEDPLETALAVLDRVLLISIFVELLVTVAILVRERKIVAEPFLLVGIIAVVRRILLVTAQTEQAAGTEEFLSLVIELGVLTALVISLSGALYITRRMERPPGSDPEEQEQT